MSDDTAIHSMHRRRHATKVRRAPIDRAAVIRVAHHFLANLYAPTATGVTVFMPDGSEFYVSADNAHALHGKWNKGSRT
jgi:hypothetical protein